MPPTQTSRPCRPLGCARARVGGPGRGHPRAEGPRRAWVPEWNQAPGRNRGNSVRPRGLPPRRAQRLARTPRRPARLADGAPRTLILRCPRGKESTASSAGRLALRAPPLPGLGPALARGGGVRPAAESPLRARAGGRGCGPSVSPNCGGAGRSGISACGGVPQRKFLLGGGRLELRRGFQGSRGLHLEPFTEYANV